jgi:hypothetical protein
LSDPDDGAPCRWRGDTLVLYCRVQPNARRDGFAGLRGARLKLSLAAPPVEGKANARAIAFLAKTFGVPRSRVQLVRGAGSSDKVFVISAPAVIPEAVAAVGC